MGDNIAMHEEFKKLDREMNKREKAIVDKWLADKPHLVRGECNTPEMRALRQEYKERYFEIVEKYKNTDSKWHTISNLYRYSINVLCCERAEKYD